jgi:hypothetical protein
LDKVAMSKPEGQPRWVTPEARFYVLALKCFVAHCVVSVLTLPFIDELWLGEVPVLVVVQTAKTALAGWLRTEVVMRAIAALGLSRGSYSPDYAAAGPWALAIVYLAPLAVLLGLLWVRTRPAQPVRFWACLLLVAAAVDFCFTLRFASGPGLTIY